MSAIAVIAQIFALIFISTPTPGTPSPAPTISAAIAAPTSTPSPTSAPILGGVTLGEDSARVLRRLGLHPRGWGANGQGPLMESRVFPSGCGDLAMALVFDDTIHDIMVQGSHDPKGQCSDPYGIRVGDTVEHLEQVRGQPDGVEKDGSLRYGPAAGGVSWQFLIAGGLITRIALDDGE